jgi:hypothetical protein
LTSITFKFYAVIYSKIKNIYFTCIVVLILVCMFDIYCTLKFTIAFSFICLYNILFKLIYIMLFDNQNNGVGNMTFKFGLEDCLEKER